jgi:NADP-dependent aldehyde dehydrogenase
MLNARIRDQLTDGRELLGRQQAVDTMAAAESAPEAGAWSSAVLYRTTAEALASDSDILAAEYFGPNAIVVEYANMRDLVGALQHIDGSLAAAVHADPVDAGELAEVLAELRRRAGRIVFNGWPTGVAVTWAMHHGGPWPATTDPGYTSVGAAAIDRWVRPVCYQNVPDALLPEGLRESNPWRLPRRLS